MTRLHIFSSCKVASLLALCLIVWSPTDCSASASVAAAVASNAVSIPSTGTAEEVGVNSVTREWIEPSPQEIALGSPPTSVSSPQLQEQDDNGYVLWELKSGVKLSSIQQTMTPAKLAPSTFWAMTMTLSGTSGAYMGLQTNSNGTLSTALFSIWNSVIGVPGNGSVCGQFGGEGVGEQCLIRFTFQSAAAYRFHFYNVGGSRWAASVSDLASGVTYSIGTILAPDSETSVRTVRDFSEYFGEPFACGSSLQSVAAWSPPTATSMGIHRDYLSSYQGTQFPNDLRPCSSWSVAPKQTKKSRSVVASLGSVVTTVPSPPTGVSALAGSAQAAVSWKSPSDTGGETISSYVVTASPGGLTCITSATNCTVVGLSFGTNYTFSVKALNGDGFSAASEPSTAVTPTTTSPVGTAVSANVSTESDVAAATLSASDGSTSETGSVTFTDTATGTALCVALLPSGWSPAGQVETQCTYNPALFTPSSGSFTATYSGDSVYGGSIVTDPYTALVNFNANGGTGAPMPPQSIESFSPPYRTQSLELNTYTNGDLSLLGWATEPNGSGLMYSNEAGYGSADSLTLYAIWSSPPTGFQRAKGAHATGYGPV